MNLQFNLRTSILNKANGKPGDQPETVETFLNTIYASFAVFANCEQLSLSDTEEANVLSLGDITHIGGTGLDFVEKLQDMLKAEAPALAPKTRTGNSDPLGGLKDLPLDPVVTLYLASGHSLTRAMAESPDDEIWLFEPRNKGSSHYHPVPLSSIAA